MGGSWVRHPPCADHPLPLWYVETDGHEPFYVRAATRSKARYMCFKQYCDAYTMRRSDFLEVMQLIHVRSTRITDVEWWGEK